MSIDQDLTTELRIDLMIGRMSSRCMGPGICGSRVLVNRDYQILRINPESGYKYYCKLVWGSGKPVSPVLMKRLLHKGNHLLPQNISSGSEGVPVPL